MLKNYLKITLRQLTRNKNGQTRLPFFTIINISGLGIGLAAFMVILSFVFNEYSYDRFSPELNQLYRVVVKKTENEEIVLNSAKTYPGIGGVIKNNIPEVTDFTRVLYEETMISYKPENIKFNQQRTCWADGRFPQLFGLNFLEVGDLELLNQPNHAILSRSAAVLFFGEDWSGDKSPIGKTIWLNFWIPFMIQGIYEDLPEESHIQADYVVSYATLISLVGPGMQTTLPPGRNNVYTYVSLGSNAADREVEKLINKSLNGLIPEAEIAKNISYEFNLQPVQSIHLNSNLADELNPNGNKTFVVALIISAVFILIIAWINFVNLSTSRSMDRAKEVGIRKALGAGRRLIAGQFIVENMLSTLLASLTAIAIIGLLFYFFQDFKTITTIFSSENILLWILFAVIVLGGGLLSSIYPAFILSSFSPVSVLKGKIYTNSGSALFRKILIIFQFSVAVLILSGTGAIYYQTTYMQNQALGFEMDQLLVVHTPRSLIGNGQRIQKFETFRDHLTESPSISSVTASGNIPGKEFYFHKENIRQPGLQDGRNVTFDVASIDEEYLGTLNIPLLAGRNFSKERPENDHIIVNETAIKVLGFKDPREALNKPVLDGNQGQKSIIGVISDVHFQGLHKQINPQVFYYGHNYEFGFFTFKLKPDNISETIALIEQEWNTAYPEDPLDYFFLDNYFAEQYKQDELFKQLFTGFALLAIIISSLGLFGLASFTARQKMKEIGIRKVLGASVPQLLLMVSSKFFSLILIASLVAIPVSYFLISKWLDSFAYRFDLRWWMYFIPLLIIFFVAVIAVSGQSIKAALTNPVKTIKEE